MKTVLLFFAVGLITKNEQVLSEDAGSKEEVEEPSLTGELVNLLNGTYFNLNEKVCQLQRRVDAIERDVDSGNRYECNETDIDDDFKQSVSVELETFSKILSGFENQLRILQNEQAYLRELISGAGNNGDASTSTTTTAPRVCDQGWISSPEKCYYVSTTAEKTEWHIAIDRCVDIGANLVEIQTDEEAAFIGRNLPSRISNTDIIYTGRTKLKSGGWVFISNNKMVDTSVRSWGSGEPDGGSQNCGCTQQSDHLYMHDCSCTGWNLAYICEIVR